MAKANPKRGKKKKCDAGYIARRKRLRKKAIKECDIFLGPGVSVQWKYGILYLRRTSWNCLEGCFVTKEQPILGVPVMRRPGFVSEGPQSPKERVFRNRQRVPSVLKMSSGYGYSMRHDDW